MPGNNYVDTSFYSTFILILLCSNNYDFSVQTLLPVYIEIMYEKTWITQQVLEWCSFIQRHLL